MLCVDVVVLDTATVKDLKSAIKTKTDEMQQEQLGHRHISWSVLFFLNQTSKNQ